MAKKKLKIGIWSKDEVRILKKLGPNMSTQELALQLNRPFEATKKKLSRMGIYKKLKYLKKLGRTQSK